MLLTELLELFDQLRPAVQRVLLIKEALEAERRCGDTDECVCFLPSGSERGWQRALGGARPRRDGLRTADHLR
jgi:hypothetical protein